MGVDQHGGDAGAPEHGGGSRAGETAADNGNIGLPHGRVSLSGTAIFAAKRLNEA